MTRRTFYISDEALAIIDFFKGREKRKSRSNLVVSMVHARLEEAAKTDPAAARLLESQQKQQTTNQ